MKRSRYSAGPRCLRVAVLAAALAAVMPGCASLEEGLRGLVRAPRFEQAPDQPAEISFTGATAAMPAGGATVRIWTKVTNPNPYGFTLSTLDATLFLDGSRAATGMFPLGLPLEPSASAVVPLELSISFADAPALVSVAHSALTGEPVEYRVDGTVAVDAGSLGKPSFGPLQLFRGELRPHRSPGGPTIHR